MLSWTRLLKAGRIVLAIPCLALFFAAKLSLVQAAEAVQWRKLGQDSDSQFVRSLLKEAEEYRIPRQEGWLDETFVLIGSLDLDEDGSPELFLQIEHSYNCGTAGCGTLIFRRQDGRWTEIGRFTAWTHIRKSDSEAVDGFATLLSMEGGARWDGKRYRWFCYENDRRCGR